MIKSNGAIKYEATDLATIYNRVKEFKPKKILYVIDKRQEMQMFMVFQAAEQIKLYKADECEFLGFGTINGPDGTPLKTRSGGAASLQSAIDDIYAASLKVIQETKKKISQKEKEKIAYCIALASLKFADLSNYRANDYIFTPDKFTRYEGKTGTYILYTTVRIKSILKKVKVQTTSDIEVKEECEKKLLLKLLDFSNVINEA
jgi:arginyl-tRNA synthetase